MTPKEPTTGKRVQGLEKLVREMSRETGRSVKEIFGEIKGLSAAMVPMERNVREVREDVGILSNNTHAIKAQLETELKHLATKEEVTSAIATCREQRDKLRRDSKIPQLTKGNTKVIGALVLALTALSGVVWLVIKVVERVMQL